MAHLEDGNESQSNEIADYSDQALQFYQKLVKENNVLRLHVQELEEKVSYYTELYNFVDDDEKVDLTLNEGNLETKPEINSTTDNLKHESNEEWFEKERNLKEQILSLKHEVETLRNANTDLQETVKNETDTDSNIQQIKKLTKSEANLKCEKEVLENELNCVKSDLEILQKKKFSEISEIKTLKDENKQLYQNFTEAKQNVIELELKLKQALAEVNELSNQQDKDDLIENLSEKVRQQAVESEISAEREADLKQSIICLENDIKTVRDANQSLQKELENLLSEYGHLAVDHEKLRKRLMIDRDKKTFKDFVSMKRELNTLRDENEGLKALSHGSVTSSGKSITKTDLSHRKTEKKKENGALSLKNVDQKTISYPSKRDRSNDSNPSKILTLTNDIKKT